MPSISDGHNMKVVTVVVVVMLIMRTLPSCASSTALFACFSLCFASAHVSKRLMQTILFQD